MRGMPSPPSDGGSDDCALAVCVSAEVLDAWQASFLLLSIFSQ
jgi:hypothetical protein